MDAFQELIKASNWTLQLPIRIRGMMLDEQSLQFEEVVSASAREIQDRVLVVRVPRMKGEDVRHVQEVLKSKGLLSSADGIFGPQTADAVARFQQTKGLKADGIVGPATYAALGV
jgi:peptidoglycan hydrolase-like protein with peptidoglycan-binding domain